MVSSVPAWTTEQVLVGREGDRKDDKQKGKKRREEKGRLKGSWSPMKVEMSYLQSLS